MIELKTCLMKVKESSDKKATCPQEIMEFMGDNIRQLAQEAFFVITIDSKNNIIDKHMITLGLVNATLIHPREIFRAAIVDNAVAIILVHNHPSGNPEPSSEDMKITKVLVEAGKIIDIQVLDHVIIGKTHFSMRRQGVFSF